MRLSIPSQRSRFIKRRLHVDTEDPDRFSIEDSEELDRLITHCRETEEANRHSRRDGLFPVAEMPITVWEKMQREGRTSPDDLRKWLNDPDNAPFRTWKGRV